LIAKKFDVLSESLLLVIADLTERFSLWFFNAFVRTYLFVIFLKSSIPNKMVVNAAIQFPTQFM
jgi:hypothetical protein